MAEFNRSLAVVIGINEYQDYPKLRTARYDAERLAEILAIEHKYDHVILVSDETYKEYRQGQEEAVENEYQPTLNGLLNLLDKKLQSTINPTKEDRLLFYFAGHGIPDDSDEGPKGYLVPLDADSKKRDSLLPMQELYKYLAALNCRHFLVVLDCCFAGRFRWESTRKGRTFPKVIHKEHYERFINSPAWQAITSASHDQEAFDILGDRGTVEGTKHSPFAEGLFKALQGEADVIPAGKNGQSAGDGVITATELYLYLRDHVEIGSKERQTPGLWSLPKHERGEYIFLVPGTELKLKPAPKVNDKNNPYRGLESFDEEHSRFFFGREELIQQLSERISAPKQLLTVVLGVSGSGKSSLVKAGLIPRLKNSSKSEASQANLVNTVHQWHILNPMRPGESPFTALAKVILTLADVTGSNQPDTLNFLKVSAHLDRLTFLTEVLEQKVNVLKAEVDKSSFENGEESSETLRCKKELEKFISIAKGWNQNTRRAKQLLIVEYFEELYTLCRNETEQQQLQQAVSDCLDPLSLRLQSDPNQLIDIVTTWSQKNRGVKLLLTIDQLEELITLNQSKQKDKQNNKQQQQKKPSNQLTQEVQQENKPEEWQQFLSLLEKALSANLEQLRIIVTLRSDFEPRFLNSDALKSYWTKARFPIRAMRSDELRQAIERPAVETALYFEPPSLVDKLIDEVGQMPGALPLLSFTLSELYIKLAEKWRIQETSDRALTLDAEFDKEGGVAGSLTRRANEEYDKLPDDAHRATLRRVMLRMVTFEGGELARRRVPESELKYADATENERVKLILEQFDRTRLIVSGQETGEPYVEPAHDFLVRSWDKLQKWQQEEQEDLPLQRRLTPVALEWKSKEQSSSLLGKTEPVLSWMDKKIDSVEDWLNKIKKDAQERRRERKGQFLWNGNPYLDVLKKRLKSYDHWFNQVETDFVQQSLWQRRRNTNLRWGLTGLAFFILSCLTFWALTEQRKAVINQISSSRESSETDLGSNQLTLDAVIQSLQAGRSSKHWLLRLVPPDSQLQNQVIDTLRKAVYLNREQQRWQLPQGEVVQDTIISQDGKKLLIATTKSEGTICVWDLKSESGQKPCEKIPETFRSVSNAKFSPDGTKLALMGEKSDQFPPVYLWDWEKNKFYEAPRLPGKVNSVSFSPNRKALALISGSQHWQGIAYIWNWESNQVYPLTKGTVSVQGISFKQDGALLMATITKTKNDDHKTVSLWNYDFTKVKFLGKFTDWLDVDDALISPNGTSIVTTAGSARRAGARSHLWTERNNVENNKELQFLEESQYLGEALNLKLNFSPDGEELAIRYSNGTVRLLNSSDGSQVTEFKGHQGLVSHLSFSPNGQQMLTVGNDSTIRLWNIIRSYQEDNYLPILRDNKKLQNSVHTLSISSDGKQLATLEKAGQIHLWDLSSGQYLKHLKHFSKHYNTASQLIFNPNSKQLAIVEKTSANGNEIQYIHLLDLGSGKEQSPPFKYNFKNISVKFSADGKKLAIIGFNSDWTKKTIIHLLDLQTRKELSAPLQYDSEEIQVSFSPDGKIFAIIESKSDNSKSFGVIDLATQEEKILWNWDKNNKMKGDIADISWKSDPKGDRVLVTLYKSRHYHDTNDGLDIWDFFSGKQLASLNLGQETMLDIQDIILNHESSLVTIYLGNYIILWDWQSGQRINLYLNGSYQTNPDSNEIPLKYSEISRDASAVATLENNGKVKVWQLGKIDELLTRGCQQLREYLATLDEKNSDRHLCDNIPPSTPSAPVNDPAPLQNVPSLTPPFNNGQDSYKQARSDREQARELNSTSVETYINQGLAYHRQRNYQQAIRSYSKAINLNPNSAKAYSNRAAAYNEQKEYQKAIVDSDKAIGLIPTYVNAYINRGLAYYHQGKYQEAIADYDKAIEYDPNNANAYHNRALAYTRLGNQQAAQANQRKAAALSQKHSQ